MRECEMNRGHSHWSGAWLVVAGRGASRGLVHQKYVQYSCSGELFEPTHSQGLQILLHTHSEACVYPLPLPLLIEGWNVVQGVCGNELTKRDLRDARYHLELGSARSLRKYCRTTVYAGASWMLGWS